MNGHGHALNLALFKPKFKRKYWERSRRDRFPKELDLIKENEIGKKQHYPEVMRCNQSDYVLLSSMKITIEIIISQNKFYYLLINHCNPSIQHDYENKFQINH